MLKHALATGALVMSLSLPATAADWKLDPAHSELNFTVKHMVISNVTGEFTDFTGEITGFDGKSLDGAQVTVTAKSASINTDNSQRDKHLRSADFFSVEEYPELKFVSTKVIPGKDGKFQLVGDLTMRGVTKPVTFDCEFNGTIDDSWGNTRAGFSADATVNRLDYGISWSKSLDSGGLVVSDDVRIHVGIEAVMAKPQEG